VSEITPFIPALNGLEIINDLCSQVTEKLSTDCNLREIDGYAGGYKATVKIHIEAFGLDQAVVDYDVVVDLTNPSPENPMQEPDTIIDTEIEIPVEENLSEVRERSQQVAGDFERKPEVEMTQEGPIEVPQPNKRKYTRRLQALAAAQGAATGSLDE
jgi:hypothetical protein